METFASRVSSRRDDLGMTQGDVAKLSGLRQPDISKIERGLILKTTEMLGLARALRCNPYWLETGKGSKEARALDVFPALEDQLLRHIVNLATLLQAVPKETVDAAYFAATQALIAHMQANPSAAKSLPVDPGRK